MFSTVSFRKFVSPYVFLILIAVVLTILTDVYVLDYGISYREVIVALVLVAAIRVLMAGHRGLKVGLVFLVATFGLGYRTIEIIPGVRVHPSELVVLGLVALLIIQQAMWRRSKVRIWLPTWLILFIPFLLWGWWPLFSGGTKWELMFSEFRNFIILIPLCVLSNTVLVEKSSWRSVLLTFYFVGGWIAAMGILEYLYPQVKTLLPGFVSDPIPYETGEGFQRATFSFWGSADAAYVCVLALPMSTAIWEWWSTSWTRVLNVLLTATMLGEFTSAVIETLG